MPSDLVPLVEAADILLDDLPGVFAVERIGPALGEVDLDLAGCDLVLELSRSPAGAPVELQPFLHSEGLRLRIVGEHAWVGDRIARTDEAVIGMLASRVDLLAADDGGGRGRISLGLSRDLTHVAVLAGDAVPFCRTVPILIPNDLELDAEVDGDLVTADAELRLGELRIRHHAVVNARAPTVLAGSDGVGFLIGEDVFDDALLAGAVDRIEDLARLDPALAVDLAVLLLDAVAGDAGYALAGDRSALPKRCVALLTELGADLRVAADAEGADRALGQRLELLLEGVEHRRDRRIGMVRGSPFLVDFLVAFPALRGGGIERERFLVYRRDRGVLVLRAFGNGAEDGHLSFAVRARAGGQLLLAAHCPGLSVRSFGVRSLLFIFLDEGIEYGARIGLLSLGQPDTGLYLRSRDAPRFVGFGGCRPAEECCVAQDRARESAEKYRNAGQRRYRGTHYSIPPIDPPLSPTGFRADRNHL